jgi:membrane fusion protein (multidrug efflux system)
VDALPDQVFEARVTAIEPAVDASTRNFKVRASLANTGGELRPGTFGRVGFDLGQSADVVVVPQTSVSFNPYGNSVYVVVDAPKPAAGAKPVEGMPQATHTVKQRFVTTGSARGDLVGITGGLKPGEVVVTSGLLRLRNDVGVTINNKVQPAAQARPEPENR